MCAWQQGPHLQQLCDVSKSVPGLITLQLSILAVALAEPYVAQVQHRCHRRQNSILCRAILE